MLIRLICHSFERVYLNDLNLILGKFNEREIFVSFHIEIDRNFLNFIESTLFAFKEGINNKAKVGDKEYKNVLCMFCRVREIVVLVLDLAVLHPEIVQPLQQPWVLWPQLQVRVHPALIRKDAHPHHRVHLKFNLLSQFQH